MTLTEVVRIGLQEFETREGVRVIYACEVGSNAQGLASKTSDYDVRFLFVHPVRRYLSMVPPKDTIDIFFDDRRYEVQGRDLRSALVLLSKSNPSIVEQLTSPAALLNIFEAQEQLQAALANSFSPRTCIHSYINMTKKNLASLAGDHSAKKHINVMRPALTARWLGLFATYAPTDFMSLAAGVNLQTDLLEILRDLVQCKQQDAPVSAAISSAVQQFIGTELIRLASMVASFPSSELRAPATVELDILFCSMLTQVWGVDLS